MKTYEEHYLPSSKILTVPQAAVHLQVSERTVYEWLRDGKLPGRKIGKVWRMSTDAIADFLRGDMTTTGPLPESRHD